MQKTEAPRNEVLTAAAFSKQSVIFDQLYAENEIIRYKRERVRNLLYQLLAPGSHILELNSGTGDDACWFASQGHQVHATDISTGMQEQLREKVRAAGLADAVTTEICSFNHLDGLKERGPYDLIFSNFAGLNCTGALDQVLRSFSPLLKPGGRIVLVVMPAFCVWETALFFKGKWKTAFRRFFSKNGVQAKVEGLPLTCWYYNPSYIKKQLSPDFEEQALEGLCCIVPPSYMEGFAEKHPRIYHWLKRAEDRRKASWCWRSVGDYYISSWKKRC